MARAVAATSIAFGGLSLGVWLANALEATVLRPSACTLTRMQLEGYLFLGRLPALVLPFIGVLLAIIAVRDTRRLRVVGAVLNLVAILCLLAFVFRWFHLERLPCVRS